MALRNKTRRAPIVRACSSGLPKRGIQFLYCYADVSTCNCHKRFGEEPPVLIVLFATKMPTRAGHGQIGDILNLKLQHLMNMPGNEILNSEFLG